MPRIKILTMFRLGLFQMGLGIMSLLTLGVLNRVMIDELKVLPLIAAGAIAMHQFVSPARVWFGQIHLPVLLEDGVFQDLVSAFKEQNRQIRHTSRYTEK